MSANVQFFGVFAATPTGLEKESVWIVSSTACLCDSASSAELFPRPDRERRENGKTNKLLLFFCSSGPKKAEKSPLTCIEALSLNDARQWLWPILSTGFLQITEIASYYVTWALGGRHFTNSIHMQPGFILLGGHVYEASKTPAVALKLVGESRRVWLTTQRKNAKATCELWRPFLTLPGSCLWDHSWLMR